MHTSEQEPVESPEARAHGKKLAKRLGAFVAGTAAVVGSYIAFGPDGEPAPTSNTVTEQTTSSTESSTEATIAPEEGVVATPNNPDVTVPADQDIPPEGGAIIDSDEGSTAVTATPEDTVPAETSPTAN